METGDLIPHLFRTEYRKIVSVLVRRYGFDQMETAEDIAGETFLAAAQTWSYKGLPENPTAWLYHVAKNKAKNFLGRTSHFDRRIVPLLQHEALQSESEIDLSEPNIGDSQLRMMFAICHPSLPPEAQVGLALRILCGFSVDEIADAFLTTRPTIEKRLTRAREKLRKGKIRMEVPDDEEIEGRLDNVLCAVYLLFTEGCYASYGETSTRRELCAEAMRLCALLLEMDLTRKPRVHALFALMCFHASRFDARAAGEGELVLYSDQEESLWDQRLIEQGMIHLRKAVVGDQLSRYHLEAAIAYHYTTREKGREHWAAILRLYDQLLEIEPSPAAAINRIVALSRVMGVDRAIAEAKRLKPGGASYFALLGELHSHKDTTAAADYFREAIAQARNGADRRAIQQKLDRLIGPVSTGR